MIINFLVKIQWLTFKLDSNHDNVLKSLKLISNIGFWSENNWPPKLLIIGDQEYDLVRPIKERNMT